MQLTDIGLKNNQRLLVDKGYILPQYNRCAMKQRSEGNPTWVHFGAGNIFRAFIATNHDFLVAEGHGGILVAESYDSEIIDVAYTPYDNLCISVKLCSDGVIQKKIVGSVAQAVSVYDKKNSYTLQNAFMSTELQIISLTITEKGYNLLDSDGNLLEEVEADYIGGPEKTTTLLGYIAGYLFLRFCTGAAPVALLSLDNCSHNGDLLKSAIVSYAIEWERNGFVSDDFIQYMSTRISYPWSMIDKITPGPDARIHQLLLEDGWEDIKPVITNKGCQGR